jgi:hypothetical protein
MKKIRLLLLLATLHFSSSNSAQVKYGTNSTSIASCSLLELESTNKGLLLPRLTLLQRNAIVSPLAGLEIWCTDCGLSGEYQYYTGTLWNTASNVPDAPTITNVVNGYSQVTLYFTASTVIGSSPITSYTITISPGNRKVTTLSSPYIFTDLISGTAYTFTVAANNAYGSSIESNTSASITPLSDSPSGSAICNGTVATKVVEIISSATGRIWMDRNLGASRVATAYNDYMAFGCFYQWGRGNDGHASMTWTASNSATRVTTTTTNVLSTVDTPSDSKFIDAISSIYDDWRNPSNNLLWQGPSGINNPCPTGYRIPTKAELDSEFDTAVNPITNYFNAYSNGGGLKFVAAGYGGIGSNSSIAAGNGVNYWTSTNKGANSYYRYSSYNASIGIYRERGCGFSVRCIKN